MVSQACWTDLRKAVIAEARERRRSSGIPERRTPEEARFEQKMKRQFRREVAVLL